MQEDNYKQNQWVAEIPDSQWKFYQRVILAARERGVPFALGGAFSLAAYTGRWRNTKDLDFYVLPSDRPAMIEAVISTGMNDYYEVKTYDRAWIYRAFKNDVIVDVIWAMANQRTEVDQTWLKPGKQVLIRGENLPVIPVEELIWGKLYVLQSDRCDWPDVLNLIHAVGTEINWEHLLARLGEDKPILSSLMALFRWLDPERAGQLPASIWTTLELPFPETEFSNNVVERRAGRLDSRPWFHPLL